MNSPHAQGTRHRRLNFIVNRGFQWRYTRYLLSSVLFTCLIAGGVTGYFLNQNYDIFNSLAFFHAPDILPQLEREQIWINSFLIFFVLAIVGSSLFFGFRLTARIAGPVFVLRRHLRQLAKGVFYQKPLKVRDSDEFKELIDSYNYFYQSLQAQIRKDIKTLSKALTENDHEKRDAVLKALLEEKQTQVNPMKSLIGRDASSGPNSDSRHAS